jgi:hypothetical protein
MNLMVVAAVSIHIRFAEGFRLYFVGIFNPALALFPLPLSRWWKYLCISQIPPQTGLN